MKGVALANRRVKLCGGVYLLPLFLLFWKSVKDVLKITTILAGHPRSGKYLQRSKPSPFSAFILHFHPDTELLLEFLFPLHDCRRLVTSVCGRWGHGACTGSEQPEKFGFPFVAAGELRSVPGGGFGGLGESAGDLLGTLGSSQTSPLFFLSFFPVLSDFLRFSPFGLDFESSVISLSSVFCLDLDLDLFV